MKQRKRHLALLRLFTIISAATVLMGGVTFAALQSQNVTLKGSSITSATASLAIGDGQGGYGTLATGFSFADVEPGGKAMPTPGYNLFLRNNGSSDLALKLTMNPNSFANPQNANTDRIFINITPISGPNVGMMQQFSLSSLLAAYTSGTPLPINLTVPAGQPLQYSLQVQMASDSVSSIQSSVSLTGIDLIFSGTSIVN